MGIRGHLKLFDGRIRQICIQLNVPSLYYFEILHEVLLDEPGVKFVVDLEEPDPISAVNFSGIYGMRL